MFIYSKWTRCLLMIVLIVSAVWSAWGCLCMSSSRCIVIMLSSCLSRFVWWQLTVGVFQPPSPTFFLEGVLM